MDRMESNFFSRLFDSITDPVALYDNDLRIIKANRALLELFGQSHPQARGRNCYQLFYNRESHCQECHIRQVFETGQAVTRLKFVQLPDGRSRHFEVLSYPVNNGTSNPRLAIEYARDITEQKKLERQLRDSEEKYRTIVEMAREGIYILDSNAVIVLVNQCLATMLGCTVEEMVGRSMFDFMEDEAKAIATQKFDQRRSGLSDVYELRLIRKDGRPLLGLISVSALIANETFSGCMGIITDITHLKATESQLRTSKAFSEKIINSITDGLTVIDPNTHAIIVANDSFCARLGLKPNELVIGRKCHEVLFGRSTPCRELGMECPVDETATTKRSTFGDRIYPDSRGQPRILQIAAYPFFDDTQEVELVIRLERDITEKRKMEEALAFRSRELQRAQNQLEVLCEISRQASSKESIRELLYFLHEILSNTFPESDTLFFILDECRGSFLNLDQCEAELLGPLRQILKRLERARQLTPFVEYLRKGSDLQLLTHHMTRPESLDFLPIFSEAYTSWLGIPICTPQQCVGYFLLGSEAYESFSREDLQFTHALFEQVAGQLQHLVHYEAEITQLRRQMSDRIGYGEIIGQSKKMQDVYELIGLVSGSDATVLITGENGTGKELVAQAIHASSHRNKGPFVVANCSAYSQTLLESELFGHEKGAFTGAINQKKGRIERAQGGTLFLDEIGEIAPATQILLLRFLQDHRFERVGGERTIKADVRVLAATNRELHREVHMGRFRDDLYYRLNVIALHLPPLRERKEDIPLLAQHFLRKYNSKEGKRIHAFSSNCMQSLMDYDWPGNVRQLENTLSHAVILCQGEVVRRKHLPKFLKDAEAESVSTSISENERKLILQVLTESNWNKHDAAKRLKVSRSTLYSKIRRYGLEPNSHSV